MRDDLHLSENVSDIISGVKIVEVRGIYIERMKLNCKGSLPIPSRLRSEKKLMFQMTYYEVLLSI